MATKELATKRIAARPDTYEKLSLYANGRGIAMSDAIDDVLTYIAERYGTDDLMEIGWQRRRVALAQEATPRNSAPRPDADA